MTERQRPRPDPAAVRRRRHRAAGADASFLLEQTLKGLEERMQPIEIAPERVLDLGCGNGLAARFAARRFRRARIVAVDPSAAMLAACRRRRSRFARIREVCADPARLPFPDAAFDLCLANLALPWSDDVPAWLGELSRTLKPGGVFLFATLGPDTLSELGDAWQAVDDHPHVQAFADMHDLGDALVRAGFSDPVLDIERLSVTYRDVQTLYRDLSNAAARNTLAGRFPGLTGRGRFRRFEAALERQADDGPFAVSAELVFGHAWASGRVATRAAGEVRIDAGGIGRRHRR